MPIELAAAAYGHALAVLGAGPAATNAAIAAVRRGGHWQVAVLAHARHEALQAARRAGDHAGASEVPDTPTIDLAEAASRLAATRPAVERAIIDLDVRHGLDRAGLGRVLGLTPSNAAARAAQVAELWERQLDPALLAWLGPGDCDELAIVLADRDLCRRPKATDPDDERGPDPAAEVATDVAEDPTGEIAPPTVAAAIDAAPAIATHIEQCEVCTDRRRAMVSVRSLLAQRPLATPPDVVVRAADSARRRPAAPPPPLESRRRFTVPRWAAAALAIFVGVGAAGAAAALGGDDGESRDDRVDELTQVRKSGSALVVSPLELDPSRPDLRIVNSSSRDLDWSLATGANWLEVAPARGRLAAGESTTVTVRLLDKAPEGGLRATITVTGSDGSTAGATFAGTLERPPEVSASQQDCLVTASVEDDGRVARVTLKWEGSVNGKRTLLQRGETWVGDLPAEDVALTWYVEAADDRGNTARSEAQELAPAACPAD